MSVLPYVMHILSEWMSVYEVTWLIMILSQMAVTVMQSRCT